MNPPNTTITFKLKQHTPLIHFQHDQEGATLRATELKPKLDKFIIQHEFGGKLNFDVYAKYLSGIGSAESIEKIKHKFQQLSTDSERNIFLENYNLAFDYSLSILSNTDDIFFISLPPKKFDNEVKKYEEVKIPSYFGNLGIRNLNEARCGVFSNNGIEVTIITFNKNLHNILLRWLPTFFVTTNFGTRQNKGFGSFSVTTLNGKEIKTEPISEIKRVKQQFFYFEYANILDYSVVLEDINNIYSLIKKGINFPNHPAYFKSYLFQYFHNHQNSNNKIGNEKRFIKNRFRSQINFLNTKHIQNNIGDSNINDFRYVRALLGVAENIEFLDTDQKKNKINYKSKEIERFQSPILFKIINNRVFILPDDSNLKEILNKKFEFSYRGSTYPISTPSEFNLNDFLESFVNYYNSLSGISTDKKDPKAVKSLSDTLYYIEKIHKVN